MIAPFDERARSASRSSQAQDWAADGKTPPLGESCGGVPAPLSYGEGTVVAAWATLPARRSLCSVSKWPPRPCRHKKTPPPDATDDGVSALQDFAVRVRSHKQCEQSNHTHSDHEHCECHGVVVQPVQPLLHGTPPCSPTLVSERAPETTPPAALRSPVHRGFG